MPEIPIKLEKPQGDAPEGWSRDAFDELLPADRFHRRTEWTGQGTAEGVEDVARGMMETALKRRPDLLVVRVEKLPDGGYAVRAYESE